MDLNKNTLVEFELERTKYSFIPPFGSDSFYNIGSGVIDLFCADNSSTDFLFELKIKAGTVSVGNGNFYVEKDKHYSKITIPKSSSLINNGNLYVNEIINVYGSMNLKSGSQLNVKNGEIVFNSDSELTIEENSDINIVDGVIKIYGKVNIDVSLVDEFVNKDGIYIDTSAVFVVQNIDLGDREFSMTDYELYLRSKIINKYTQGEYNVPNGKIGYTWNAGNIKNGSQVIDLSIIYGNAVLGDFKLSVLGTQKSIIDNLQITNSLKVKENSTLYIAESYNGFTYLKPELYLGIVIDNCNDTGLCTVDGTMIVNGSTSKITIDRGARLVISETGNIYLQNDGLIQSTNNDDLPILYINGTLTIDDISQLKGFVPSNIEFGDNGRLIILNPDTGEHRVLFSTPLGIKDSELYRLFEDRLDQVVYHIQNNNGIKIDKYFEYYNREMTDWYAGMRIEKAIHDGLIIWHDGGFMELNNEIIPWIHKKSSLLHASRLFKSSRTYDDERLQEVVDHLIYAGSGNIVFRFIEGEEYNDVTLMVNAINMRSITNDISSDVYILNTDEVGELFIKNNISDTSVNNVIDNNAIIIHLNEGDTQFSL